MIAARFFEVIALHAVDAETLQHLERFFVFDAFGDRLLS
jgi:hypothetical protein